MLMLYHHSLLDSIITKKYELDMNQLLFHTVIRPFSLFFIFHNLVSYISSNALYIGEDLEPSGALRKFGIFEVFFS